MLGTREMVGGVVGAFCLLKGGGEIEEGSLEISGPASL